MLLTPRFIIMSRVHGALSLSTNDHAQRRSKSNIFAKSQEIFNTGIVKKLRKFQHKAEADPELDFGWGP